MTQQKLTGSFFLSWNKSQLCSVTFPSPAFPNVPTHCTPLPTPRVNASKLPWSPDHSYLVQSTSATRLRDTQRPAALNQRGLQLNSTPPTRSYPGDHWRDHTQWTSGQRFPPGIPACSWTTKRRTSLWRIVDWRSLLMLEAGCLDADAAALTSVMQELMTLPSLKWPLNAFWSHSQISPTATFLCVVCHLILTKDQLL